MGRSPEPAPSGALTAEPPPRPAAGASATRAGTAPADPPRTVEVAAAVITDARGRILLARRTEGRELAGLWEFPGGKREPGESHEDALARELHEELGIRARVGAHLITVPRADPARRLCLHVRHVVRWEGVPRGREGQALAWVPPHRLVRYAMPAPDGPVVAALLPPDRYAVSPLPAHGPGAWLAGLEAALAAGVGRVQVRLPGVDPALQRQLVAGAVERCAEAGASLLVNGDAALAREFGTGLHLPAAQLAALARRPPLAPGALLGASCHDADELAHAERLGCDFAVRGHVWATPSHPGRPGLGWEGFARLRERVGLPGYAIGGLGADDLAEARLHGAQGIAAIRAFWPAVA